MLNRHNLNPLITPQHVKPSLPDFEVVGVFNAGAALYQNEVILLLRVAERPTQKETDHVLSPYRNAKGKILVRRFRRNNGRYDMNDSREIHDRQTGEVWLTSISHLRLARSRDGINFIVDEHPWLVSQSPYEEFGIEDARISKLEDRYVINYSAVSQHGISIGAVSTRDFSSIDRYGIIFPPANRDATIFPERINGQYVCYDRPMPGMFGGLNIWMATSPNLLHWGNHQLVLEKSSNGWEGGRIGGGAPPLRTEHGWLSIYHAADTENRYCLGAFLTPLDKPEKIIARSLEPILSPTAPYEVSGFFPNVVFTCGVLLRDGQVHVYYGASDEVIGLAESSLASVLDALEPI